MEAKVVEAPSGVAGCSQQDVELLATQIWVVSQSAVQLPLQLEDASRPEKTEVRLALIVPFESFIALFLSTGYFAYLFTINRFFFFLG